MNGYKWQEFRLSRHPKTVHKPEKEPDSHSADQPCDLTPHRGLLCIMGQGTTTRNGFVWERRQILSQRLEGWRVKHILGVCATLLNSKWVFKSKSFRRNPTIRLRTRMTIFFPPEYSSWRGGKTFITLFLKKTV